MLRCRSAVRRTFFWVLPCIHCAAIRSALSVSDCRMLSRCTTNSPTSIRGSAQSEAGCRWICRDLSPCHAQPRPHCMCARPGLRTKTQHEHVKMNSQYRQTTSASVWCTTRHFTPDVTAVLSLEVVCSTAHRATPSSSFSVDELRERSLHRPCGTTDDLLCRSDRRRWFNIYVDDATNDDTVKLFDILSFVYSRSAAAACQFTYLSSRSHTRCVYCP